MCNVLWNITSLWGLYPSTPRHPNGGNPCIRVDCDCPKLTLNISKSDNNYIYAAVMKYWPVSLFPWINAQAFLITTYSIRLMKTNSAVYCPTFSWFGSAFYIKLLMNVLCMLFNDAVIVLRLYSNGDIRISMEHWWNDTDRGNRNTGGGGGGGLSTTNLTWTGLGPNMDLRGERPATNRLIHRICRLFRTFSFRSWHSKQLSERFWRNV